MGDQLLKPDLHASGRDMALREQPCVVPASPSRSRRAARWLWLLPVAVAIGAVLWWQSRAQPQRPPRPEVAQAVGAAVATRGDLPIMLDGLGTVTPLATVTVQSQINGVLTEVGFREGQMVAKGDFLAQIDPRPYQVALEQAQGTLARDQALLKQAQADLARYRTLARQDSIAGQQVDDQISLVGQYTGAIQSDQAAIDAQKLNLVYCRITAPIDGRTGLRLVDAGNYVQAGGTPGLVVITKLQPITVIFSLPEDQLAPVLQRLHAGATLPVTAWDRSNSEQIATGILETVDNSVDIGTGTVKLRASFANADETLFPNQFVNAHLLVDTLEGVTLVPNSAVQTGTPGTYVYLIGPDRKVSVRVVQTGPTDGTQTAILAGLNPGDQVVIDGADRLRDGMQVTVPASASATPGKQPHASRRLASPAS